MWGKGILLALFLLFWQIPHFLLITMQMGNEYERAGFPSLISAVSRDRLKHWTFAGILACSAVTLLFLPFRIITGAFSTALLIIGNLALVSYSYFAFRNSSDLKSSGYFLYLFQGGILILLIQQSLRISN